MKKLAILMIVTMLSIFIFAVSVSADKNRHRHRHRKNFHGIYEMSLTGSCLHSMDGFVEGGIDGGPPYIPEIDSEVWGSTMMAHGTWKFYKDGTGTAEGLNYVIDFPPGIAPPGIDGPGIDGPLSGPMARGNPFTLDFTYDVTREGVITVTLDDSGFVLEGAVEVNDKSITLPSAYQEFDLVEYGLGYAVCNAARTLIRVRKDYCDE